MASPKEDVYATLLLNNSYLPGAMVLAHSLKDAGTKKKLAVLFTPDTVSVDSLTELRKIYNYLIPVERVVNGSLANLYLMGRGDLHSTFTKINLWKLLQFRKIVYMDADVLALRAPDELFDIPAPFSAAPDIGWPDIFNTGVMVLTPNMGDYYALEAMSKRGISFDGADQGLLNMHFKNSYNRLSFTYNVTPSAHYQYLPAYRHFQSSISASHFIGSEKPWNLGREANQGSTPYDEMVGRWWAVYDKHYRKPAPQVPAKLVSPTVQYYVKGERQPFMPARPDMTAAGAHQHDGHRPTQSFYPRAEEQKYGLPDVPRYVEEAQVPPVEIKTGEYGEQYIHYPEVQPQKTREEYGQAPQHEYGSVHQEEHGQQYQEPQKEHQELPQQYHEHPQHPQHPQPHPQPQPQPQQHLQQHPQHHQEHRQEYQDHGQDHSQERQQEHLDEHRQEHREEPKEVQIHVIPQASWNPSIAPPPPDSQPEASNFPATHYTMSSDITPFTAPERYPEPPKNMWYEVPTTPSHQKPALLFPWETNAPKATRVFPEDRISESEPITGTESLSPEAARQEMEEDDRSGTTALDTITAATSPSDPWASMSRANVWDEMPEIERYIGTLQRHRRVPVQVLHSRSGSGVTGTSSPGTAVWGGRRVSLKLTDFPTEVERPSLPVTPAPIRPPTYWGTEQEDEGELPAAVGVPAQEDWVGQHSHPHLREPHPQSQSDLGVTQGQAQAVVVDCPNCGFKFRLIIGQNPTLQLDKLTREQTEILTTKLLGKESSAPRPMEIPKRDLPFGSEGLVSPTYVPQGPKRSVDQGSSTGTVMTRWSRQSRDDEERRYGSHTGSTGATTMTGSRIEAPSYTGPGAAWEKDEEALAPEDTTGLLPSEEEQDVLVD
ncbi:hypothetical protein B7463_g9759, partial [Scytalidium lignicola]